MTTENRNGGADAAAANVAELGSRLTLRCRLQRIFNVDKTVRTMRVCFAIVHRYLHTVVAEGRRRRGVSAAQRIGAVNRKLIFGDDGDDDVIEGDGDRLATVV